MPDNTRPVTLPELSNSQAAAERQGRAGSGQGAGRGAGVLLLSHLSSVLNRARKENSSNRRVKRHKRGQASAIRLQRRKKESVSDLMISHTSHQSQYKISER